MTIDDFQTEVLQRLSVIETQTNRVLDDVRGVTERVDSLEASRDQELGKKGLIVSALALLGLVADVLVRKH